MHIMHGLSHSVPPLPTFIPFTLLPFSLSLSLWSVAEWSSALGSSSGVVRMWVRTPAWPVMALVSLSKTLNHNCFVLRMGHKDVGPVCCVIHVKEPRTLIMKGKRLAPVFLDSCLEHPAGWICPRYKYSVLLLLLFPSHPNPSHPLALLCPLSFVLFT